MGRLASRRLLCPYGQGGSKPPPYPPPSRGAVAASALLGVVKAPMVRAGVVGSATVVQTVASDGQIMVASRVSYSIALEPAM